MVLRFYYLLVILSAVSVSIVKGGTAQPLCALGPGYWCSGTAAAQQCGAQEYCRQLRLRSSGTSVQQQHQQQLPVLAAQSDMCATCQQVMSTIKKALLENKTEAAIAQTVKSQLCPQLGPLVEACDSLVDIFLPEVLSTISMDIQPKLICTLLGMRNQTVDHRNGALKSQQQESAAAYSDHPVLQLMELQLHPNRKPLSAVQCPRCRSAVRTARHLKQSAKSSEASPLLLQLLQSIACQPTKALTEKTKCVKAVRHYSSIISHLLASDADDGTVCLSLGACATRPAANQKLPLPHAANQKLPLPGARAGAQCLLCEFVLRELERQLGQNRSVVAIETAMEHVCSLLPSTVRPECDSFVRQYTPLVVQLLVNGLSPKRVCSTIGLCSAMTRRNHQRKPPAKWMLTYMRARRHELL